MSRTDKTRPFWVRATDDHGCAEACHDHRSGPCDLPPLGRWRRTVASGADRARRCRWEPAWWKITCGCPMCTGQIWRRPDNRRERRRTRVALRQGRFDGE